MPDLNPMSNFPDVIKESGLTDPDDLYGLALDHANAVAYLQHLAGERVTSRFETFTDEGKTVVREELLTHYENEPANRLYMNADVIDEWLTNNDVERDE